MNFDLNWKFLREDVAGAEAPAFDDSKWATVSTPHSFNDVDSFRQIISHGGGDRGTYKGLSGTESTSSCPPTWLAARFSSSLRACAKPAISS
jgi:beta-galactosidase